MHRRLQLGLFQKQVAEQIGVDVATIHNWEHKIVQPTPRSIRKILQFLGYNPLPVPRSFGGKLIKARQELGLTQKEMAKRLSVDPTTVGMWERGRRKRSNKLQMVIDNLLKSDPAEFD